MHFFFLPPVQHFSCTLRWVYQSKKYTGYIWRICATFGFCLKCLTLLVFEISGTQKPENSKKFKIFSVLIKFLIAIHSVDHFELLISCNLETCASPHIFFSLFYIFFSFRDISCQKTLRSGWAGLGRAGNKLVLKLP